MYKINKNNGAVKSVYLKDLPNDLQVKLNRAFEEYKRGNYISHQEMKVKARKWLLKN